MEEFHLHLIGSVNSDVVSELFDFMPNIEHLCLIANKLSEFSLDRFVNLKTLTMIGDEIDDDFNTSLFDNLCNQLEEITLISDFDNKCL